MEPNDIKYLAEVMKKNGITRLDFDNGNVKLVMERNPDQNSVYIPAAEKEKEAEEKEVKENYKVIKSPLVGVFYAAKAPGEPPYVEKGSKVSKGDTICIIEAMKTMNEIPSDIDGTIEEVCVKNGQIVQYGQVLFKLS